MLSQRADIGPALPCGWSLRALFGGGDRAGIYFKDVTNCLGEFELRFGSTRNADGFMIAILVSSFAFALSAQEKKAPREHSLTGCLQKGSRPDTYIVIDVEGNGPKTIGVVSSTVSLAPHVGHKIEVTGVAVPASQAEAEKDVPKAEHYMRLSGIKMISTTCP